MRQVPRQRRARHGRRGDGRSWTTGVSPCLSPTSPSPGHFTAAPRRRTIYLRFRTGMSGTPMPSFKDAASDGEMWDLANYVVSLARKPLWEMSAEEVSAHYAREDEEAGANPVRRGEYIVETRLCAVCHSPIDAGRTDSARAEDGRRADHPDRALRRLPDQQPDVRQGDGHRRLDRRGTESGHHARPDARRIAHASVPHGLASLLGAAARRPRCGDRVPAIDSARAQPRASAKPPALPVYLWGKFRMLILGRRSAR